MKRWTLRILLCLILGAITTVAVAWGVAGAALRSLPFDPNAPAPPANVKRPDRNVMAPVEPMHGDGWQTYIFVQGMTSLHWSEFCRWVELRQPELAERHLLALMASATDWELLLLLHTGERSPEAVCQQAEHLGVPSARLFREKMQGPLTVTLPLAADVDWQCLAFRSGWPRAAFSAELWTCLQSPVTTVLEFSETCGALVVPAPLGDATGLRLVPATILPLGFALNTAIFAAAWFSLGLMSFLFAIANRMMRGQCQRCGYDLRGQREGVRGEPPPRPELGTKAATSQIRCPECGWGRAQSTD